ncbi:hypothetical protein EVAR_95989_1 [Eumeta japonica]|uniref:Uncharacterized protein n=1 Tax=Eumeta variegata TaxID=151549 RepID=A0A4C1ZZD3_EUMVA|nr:hypothetical protein EVAR_95989_1 [Eumeta japonica]
MELKVEIEVGNENETEGQNQWRVKEGHGGHNPRAQSLSHTTVIELEPVLLNLVHLTSTESKNWSRIKESRISIRIDNERTTSRDWIRNRSGYRSRSNKELTSKRTGSKNQERDINQIDNEKNDIERDWDQNRKRNINQESTKKD